MHGGRTVVALALALGALWSERALAQEPPEPPDHVALRDPDPVPEAARESANSAPRPEDVKVSVLLGGDVSVATEAEVGVSPFASVSVALPLSAWSRTPWLHVEALLGGLPGAAIDIEQPMTFRSVRVVMAVCQPVAESVYVDLCAEGGFATRLPNDPGPRDRAVLWGSGGVRFGRAGRGWLTVGLARDERLDGLYRWAANVSGAVTLYEAESVRASVQLVGRAILGLERGPTAPRRDIVTVGMGVGR